jgi:hypothetical protein
LAVYSVSGSLFSINTEQVKRIKKPVPASGRGGRKAFEVKSAAASHFVQILLASPLEREGSFAALISS